MIYTKKKNLERYLGLSESMDTVIRYILTADLTKLHKGRNEIDGDQAFVNCFDYQTMTPEQALSGPHGNGVHCAPGWFRERDSLDRRPSASHEHS